MLPAPTPASHARLPGQVDQSLTGGIADLLVSVRDRRELLEVKPSRVAIVDLKEPRRGALAPAETSLWQFAAALWQQDTELSKNTKLSAALGESAEAFKVSRELPAAFHFAKVGPSGCRTEPQLLEVWHEVAALLSDTTELVGVAYADGDTADCLTPEAVFELAKTAGLGRCLVDTYTKDGRSTVDHLGFTRLRELDVLAKRLGLWWTLAGSVRCEVVAEIRRRGWMPDCFGVRGDVCEGDRTAAVSRKRVERWVAQLASGSRQGPAA